jgi:hypothetical protein
MFVRSLNEPGRAVLPESLTGFLNKEIGVSSRIGSIPKVVSLRIES